MTQVKLYIDFYKWQAGDVAELKDHSAKEFVRRGWAAFVDKKEPVKPVKPKKK